MDYNKAIKYLKQQNPTATTQEILIALAITSELYDPNDSLHITVDADYHLQEHNYNVTIQSPNLGKITIN